MTRWTDTSRDIIRNTKRDIIQKDLKAKNGNLYFPTLTNIQLHILLKLLTYHQNVKYLSLISHHYFLIQDNIESVLTKCIENNPGLASINFPMTTAFLSEDFKNRINKKIATKRNTVTSTRTMDDPPTVIRKMSDLEAHFKKIAYDDYLSGDSKNKYGNDFNLFLEKNSKKTLCFKFFGKRESVVGPQGMHFGPKELQKNFKDSMKKRELEGNKMLKLELEIEEYEKLKLDLEIEGDKKLDFLYYDREEAFKLLDQLIKEKAITSNLKEEYETFKNQVQHLQDSPKASLVEPEIEVEAEIEKILEIEKDQDINLEVLVNIEEEYREVFIMILIDGNDRNETGLKKMELEKNRCLEKLKKFSIDQNDISSNRYDYEPYVSLNLNGAWKLAKAIPKLAELLNSVTGNDNKNFTDINTINASPALQRGLFPPREPENSAPQNEWNWNWRW